MYISSGINFVQKQIPFKHRTSHGFESYIYIIARISAHGVHFNIYNLFPKF
jgi:hypothetical protein